MNEPSNQDFGDTPDSVRDYVQSLEDRIAELERNLSMAVDLLYEDQLALYAKGVSDE